MNQVELLQAGIAALSRRVATLESRDRFRQGADGPAAELAALELGLSVDVFTDPLLVNERKSLARALKAKGWSAFRIAKVLGCCERTAARWIDGAENFKLQTSNSR